MAAKMGHMLKLVSAKRAPACSACALRGDAPSPCRRSQSTSLGATPSPLGRQADERLVRQAAPEVGVAGRGAQHAEWLETCELKKRGRTGNRPGHPRGVTQADRAGPRYCG